MMDRAFQSTRGFCTPVCEEIVESVATCYEVSRHVLVISQPRLDPVRQYSRNIGRV